MLLPSPRPSPRPAPQAVRPWARLHGIDVGIGEHDTAPAPHPLAPLKADSSQRHAARIRIAPMGYGKGQEVAGHCEPLSPGCLGALRVPLGRWRRECLKLGDAHVAVGKHGPDLKLSPHRLDEMAQGTHIYFRPAFQLGDRRLLDTEEGGQVCLSQRPRGSGFCRKF